MGFAVYGLGYLDKLKTALAEGHRARLYITDGNFPKRKGDEPSYLAETAILEIRKADPQARIVVFSLYGPAKNSADKHGIPYFNKAQGPQLADYVSRELSSKQPQ